MPTQSPTHLGLKGGINASLEALEIAAENEVTAASCVWLAGDVLEMSSRIAASSLAAKVVWAEKLSLVIMVHVYHALRVGGHLHAIAEVDALLRMLRRSVFFRTGQLPTRGGFRNALALAIGATASSIKQGAPEQKHGRIFEYTGINPSEFSLIRYVDQFFGADLDVAQLDLRAIAREEVMVLNRAPTLAGALKLLRVRDVMRQAGLRDGRDVVSEADGIDAGAAASSAACWEQVFPGCSCVPPAPEAAVPLVFSSYTQIAPAAGLKGAYASSYTPASERLTREQLKQRYKEASARARGAR